LGRDPGVHEQLDNSKATHVTDYSEVHMSQARRATMRDLEDFITFKKLNVSEEEARKLLEDEKLIYESSEFKDPGEDYVRLLSLEGTLVGYWEGF
jgi:hypothetical protein